MERVKLTQVKVRTSTLILTLCLTPFVLYQPGNVEARKDPLTAWLAYKLFDDLMTQSNIKIEREEERKRVVAESKPRKSLTSPIVAESKPSHSKRKSLTSPIVPDIATRKSITSPSPLRAARSPSSSKPQSPQQQLSPQHTLSRALTSPLEHMMPSSAILAAMNLAPAQ